MLKLTTDKHNQSQGIAQPLCDSWASLLVHHEVECHATRRLFFQTIYCTES